MRTQKKNEELVKAAAEAMAKGMSYGEYQAYLYSQNGTIQAGKKKSKVLTEEKTSSNEEQVQKVPQKYRITTSHSKRFY